MGLEYRVIWKREGLKPKRKRYANMRGVERMLILLGPEPWRAYAGWRNKPDDFECCSGRECGCSGITHRQRTEQLRAEMPRLEWVKVESREVGAWAGAEASR